MKNWQHYHARSEQYASQAEILKKQGQDTASKEAYRLAAELEIEALGRIDIRKVKTLGVIAVSAVALLVKSNDEQRAKSLASQWLNTPLPPFAVQELRQILHP